MRERERSLRQSEKAEVRGKSKIGRAEGGKEGKIEGVRHLRGFEQDGALTEGFWRAEGAAVARPVLALDLARLLRPLLGLLPLLELPLHML